VSQLPATIPSVSSPTPVPAEILTLVERFDRNRAAYEAPQYNETQVRREFIDPLFKALGWDIDNTQGYAEPYKDVVHEYSMRIEGAANAPDYSFRIGGTRKFFVEAKKPGVNVKDDPRPAYQLRRYAWSAKLPISVVTDFAEFAVYDTRSKPEKTDRASAARVLYMTCNEYAARWHELASVLSREAILLGSFDSFAEEMKGQPGHRRSGRRVPVRDAGLAGAARSTSSDSQSRSVAVRTQLCRSANNRPHRVPAHLRRPWHRGVRPTTGTGEGKRCLRTIVRNLSPCGREVQLWLVPFPGREKSARDPGQPDARTHHRGQAPQGHHRPALLPGQPVRVPCPTRGHPRQVYEQFLGQVIRLTAGHRAVVEDKPEVKKAGGVYYTPTYIVDYIVRGTLGGLLNGKSVRQVARIRVLDPACGSGSFLISAYQHLLDWHLTKYLADGAAAHQAELRQGSSGDWRLTTKERKRILLNSIYGVDIDPQAVEVSKLSLMLKVLEGETEETLNQTLRLFHERALPDLANNIKCGNSLVGTDVQEQLVDDDAQLANPFDWDQEFPAIMSNGGFEVVIGNPPYDVLEKDRGKSSWPHEVLADYVRARRDYKPALGGKTNLYRYFIVRCLGLVRPNGRFGMIVPLSLLADISTARTRQHLMLSTKNLVADCFPQKDKARKACLPQGEALDHGVHVRTRRSSTEAVGEDRCARLSVEQLR
jgi:hypothetical protein